MSKRRDKSEAESHAPMKKLKLQKAPYEKIRQEPTTSEIPPKMEIPATVKDSGMYKRLSLFQFIYSISGLVLGLVCILGGMVLFLNGIVGSTRWTTKLLGLESSISDAAPGAVLFVVGLLIIFVTKFTVKVRK